jgi:hypothetical protein
MYGDVMDGMQKDQVVIMNATIDINKIDVKSITNVLARNVAHEQVGCNIMGELCGGNHITSGTWDNFSDYRTLQP